MIEVIAIVGIVAGLGIMGRGVALLQKLTHNHASHIQSSLADISHSVHTSTATITQSVEAGTNELRALRKDIRTLAQPSLRPARAKRRKKS